MGLDPRLYGTHSMRRTKVSILYKRDKNIRAIQLLLGHKKMKVPSVTSALTFRMSLKHLNTQIFEMLVMKQTEKRSSQFCPEYACRWQC
jgi:integrase